MNSQEQNPKKSSAAPSRRLEPIINKNDGDDGLTQLPTTLLRIGIAADHGGYELKEFLAGKLRGAGHEVVDFDDSRPKEHVDYPDFVVPLAYAVGLNLKVDSGSRIQPEALLLRPLFNSFGSYRVQS